MVRNYNESVLVAQIKLPYCLDLRFLPLVKLLWEGNVFSRVTPFFFLVREGGGRLVPMRPLSELTKLVHLGIPPLPCPPPSIQGRKRRVGFRVKGLLVSVCFEAFFKNLVPILFASQNTSSDAKASCNEKDLERDFVACTAFFYVIMND